MAWSLNAPALPAGSSWGNSASIWYHNTSRLDAEGSIESARGLGNTFYLKFSVFLRETASVVPNTWLYPGPQEWGFAQYMTGSVTFYYEGTKGDAGNIEAGFSFSNSGLSGAAGTTWNYVYVPAPQAYTVSFNGNNATGGYVAPQSVISGGAITIPANAYTRTGYTFIQWNTAANGTGTGYSPGASFTPGGNTTLYAIWQINTYAVTYNGNGADGGSTAAQTKTYGVDLTISANGFTRDKYIFLYWNTASDGTGTTYEPGDTYSTNAALTLYAIWKKANIPLYVNDNNTIRQIEKAYMNIGGEIKECTVYANINGEIKEFV